MIVLVADAVSEAALERLRMAGHEVIRDAALNGDALLDALREHDPAVMVVRSTRITAEMLDAAPGLELIVRAGAGTDTIDVEGASRRGVFVANCPGKNAAAVAELAFGLILSLDRRIPDNVSAAREGRWDKKTFASARGLHGRTLGLIGLGNIGREMVVRAAAFGMPVVAWSRSLTPEDAAEVGVTHAESPEAVAEQADVVSLHVASTPDTKHIAGEAFFEALRPGAFVINTARAPVMDAAAMRRAMDEKNVHVATDVPPGEPQAKQGDLALDGGLEGHSNFYVTHHIGASTDQATEAIGQEAARVILTYADTGRVPNCINLADQSPATHLLTVRHHDKVGVLAGVLDLVRQAEWNVQEMENLIFAGAQAACARIRFTGDPDEGTLAAINDLPDVLNATAIAL